jgi:predicted nuclease of predicted toxin-antitoxin system
MRIIDNENISGVVISKLRRRGHDVLSVKEVMRGSSDAKVLSRANVKKRLVITHDKDFGELAFRSGLNTESGVLLFRLSGEDPETDEARIIEVFENRSDWAGHFSVVDNRRIRMRTLP